jgi:hypothetical protein
MEVATAILKFPCGVVERRRSRANTWCDFRKKLRHNALAEMPTWHSRKSPDPPHLLTHAERGSGDALPSVKTQDRRLNHAHITENLDRLVAHERGAQESPRTGAGRLGLDCFQEMLPGDISPSLVNGHHALDQAVLPAL